MNDKLYNELFEYCSGDLDELERTLDYFRARLESGREIDRDNELEEEEDDESEGS